MPGEPAQGAVWLDQGHRQQLAKHVRQHETRIVGQQDQLIFEVQAQALTRFQALDHHAHGDGAAAVVSGHRSIIVWKRHTQQAIVLLEKANLMQTRSV